ncbi:hypothetical protein TRVA0_003S04874 [Trichomonascus vanleenenianus]|uniref:uncharacterized protein n=1 Tax=Trichomonascus vanleenenianus TaxID=2268995 RepID=UPI003ECA1B9A
MEHKHNLQMEQETMKAASEEWQHKLMGKYLIRHTKGKTEHDEVLESELPNPHRVVTKGVILTHDSNPDRMNVVLDDDDMIEKVYFG